MSKSLSAEESVKAEVFVGSRGEAGGFQGQERRKTFERPRLQLVNMSGRHLCILIIGIWVLILATGLSVLAALWAIRGGDAREGASPRPVVVDVKMPEAAAPVEARVPDLQVFMVVPSTESGRPSVVRVEGVEQGQWPENLKLQVDGLKDIARALRERPSPDVEAPVIEEGKKSDKKVDESDKAGEGKEKEKPSGGTLPPPKDVKRYWEDRETSGKASSEE